MAEDNSYTIIAYLIGTEKYKQLFIEQFSDKQSVLKKYRDTLNTYTHNNVNSKEFVMVMLDNKHRILTAWALETPVELRDAADLALNKFEKGEELYIDRTLTLI
jgi:hypothetical protein